MAFQLQFNNEELQGKPPLPSGWYQLIIKDFKPKAAKLKPGETESTSLSLNAQLEVVNNTNPEYDGRKVFAGLNTKMAFMWPDFVHAAGMPMEEVQNADAGTEKASYTLPGVFENADTKPDNPEEWKYLGPLLNKVIEVELAEIPAQGGFKAKNEIRQYKCAVPGCVVKHSTNLIFNGKKD